jgi:hypothetical protein
MSPTRGWRKLTGATGQAGPTAPRRRLGWALGLTMTAGVLASSGCNEKRKQECERFLAALKPVDQGMLSAGTVAAVITQVQGLDLQDVPLRVYADNTVATLRVLGGTLELNAGSNPPDGTDDVIKTNLQKARADARDVAHYCAE